MKRFIAISILLMTLTGCSTIVNCPICGFDFDPDKAEELANEREERRHNGG